MQFSLYAKVGVNSDKMGFIPKGLVKSR